MIRKHALHNVNLKCDDTSLRIRIFRQKSQVHLKKRYSLQLLDTMFYKYQLCQGD